MKSKLFVVMVALFAVLFALILAGVDLKSRIDNPTVISQSERDIIYDRSQTAVQNKNIVIHRYDQNNKLIEEIDQNRNVTVYYYDENGKLVK